MHLKTLDDPLADIARAAFERRLQSHVDAPLAVALSGGGDSLALLHLACGWARIRGRRVIALTLDHGLNRDSAAWTVFARDRALEAGARWRGLTWTGPKPARGLPAAARDARHRLIAEAAREAGCRVVLFGHTADDIAEAALMRATDTPDLGRLYEWAPSPVWPEGRGLFLLRPLLGARRLALREWLEARGLDWLDDPANGNLAFARARARLHLSTAHPGEGRDPGVLFAGNDASEDNTKNLSPGLRRDERDREIQSLAGQATITADGHIDMRLDGLSHSGPAAARRFVASALLCAAGTDRPPRTEALDRLLNRLIGSGTFCATLAGARVDADGMRAIFAREPGERRRGGLQPVALTPGKTAVWDGRFEVETATEGLTVQPLAGLAARLDRAERDALRGLPPQARAALPALTHTDGTVFLPFPFGAGPARVRALAGERLAGACGLTAQEGHLNPVKLAAPHGAEATVILS